MSTGTVTDCCDRSGSVVVTWRAAMKERDHERKAGDAALAALHLASRFAPASPSLIF